MDVEANGLLARTVTFQAVFAVVRVYLGGNLLFIIDLGFVFARSVSPGLVKTLTPHLGAAIDACVAELA